MPIAVTALAQDGPPPVRQDADGSRWYPYPPIPGRMLTSATTITGGTQRKAFLDKWKTGKTAGAAVDNLALLAAVLAGEAVVVSSRESGRKAAIQWLRDAGERERAMKADAGTYVHKVAEALWLWAQTPEKRGDLVALPPMPPHLIDAVWATSDDGEDEMLAGVVEAMVDGFTRFAREWDPVLIASEMKVYNLQMGVAGTLDMILVIDNAAIVKGPRGYDVLVRKAGSRVVLIVDIKTGKYLEAGHEEQQACYRRCTECDPTGLGQLIPMYQSDATAILHLRKEFRRGYRLKVIPREADTAAWNSFRDAARLFTRRETVKHVGVTVYPPTAAEGEIPDVDIADLEGYGRAPGALVKAGFEWLTELTVFSRAELTGVKKSKGVTGSPGVKGVGPATADVTEKMLADHGLALKPTPETDTAAA